jgi:hypothetical protein
MKKLISAKTAGNILLVLLILLSVFHILVLFNVLPSDIVWGGRAAESPGSLLMFEIIGLVLTFLFIFGTLLKLGYIKTDRLKTIKKNGPWVMCFWFALNTITNLLAWNSLETMIFVPVSLIMSLCALRLIFEKEED